MNLFGDRVVCCTADLVAAARCEFALLRALDAELGLVPAVVVAPAVTADPHGDLPIDLANTGSGRVVRVDPPGSGSLTALHDAQERTLAALGEGADVIVGATFFDGFFVSSGVLLTRTAPLGDRRPGPEVTEHTVVVAGDAGEPVSDPAAVGLLDGTPAGPTRYELRRRMTTDSLVATLTELAACADAMQRNGFQVSPELRVLNSDDVDQVYQLAEPAAVYSARRRRLAAILEAKQNELLPVQWGDRRYLACGHCPTCTAALSTGRDLLLIAGLRPALRAQLRDAGITTIDRLAHTTTAVTGVADRTLKLVQRQAELQLRRERTGQPAYAITEPEALAALPVPTAGDVFLAVDTTAATSGRVDAIGVAVLPASVPEDGGESPILFHAFEIDDDPAALPEYLADRRRRYPNLRIYHCHTPARQLLAQLCSRCDNGDEITADLLGALIDLHPIVCTALVMGERSAGPADLVVALGGEPDPVTAGNTEPDLESDCVNTLILRDRLYEFAVEHEIQAAPPPPDTGTELPSAVEAALREYAADDRTPPAAAETAARTAAVLGYHRRERLPLHWAHTDRLHRPVAEWSDTAGVLAADRGAVDTDWHSTGEGPMRRYLTLTGRLGTGSVPPPGTAVLTLYDHPVPGLRSTPGRRGFARATVLGSALDADFADTVRVVELLPAGCEPYPQLPIAIVPGPPVPTEHISAALEETAHRLLVSLPERPADAAFDLLARRPPRLLSGGALPEVCGDHAAAVTAAVLDLDDSWLAVQGPSGTGKIDVIGRVIERLVTRNRWRVGVVAQSHAAVERILDEVVRAGVLPELVAKSDANTVAAEWLSIDIERYPRFLDNAVNGCVIGGLPEAFADPECVAPGALDLLVIADAGRLPLADTVAVAGSARNLLLLGDPVPLDPGRPAGPGLHPEPVHCSALGWLLGESPTLPTEFGYFLDRTWRLHPTLCRPVSRLRYGNRLRSNETVTLARDLDGVPAGVAMVPVEHHGNSTESAEEAREIVRQVRGLLGLQWRQGALTRRLHPHDILVITPYHAQQARIRALLSRARIEDVMVGTPDRFAGREAAVVLISMATSSPSDAPHGIGALLSRHWIGTAVSRAMWTAVIVGSPLLTAYLPETPEQLTDLAAYLELGAQ
ncbi:bifunctional RecB family nuclease/DEAD/DEAH box helicase [Nocardia stercoris]|uniref:DNA2/NAM7 helicase-like C-terminal domain-containing protein n=1 Tax=Nocardia stercoris TaxID=2483361 RepID=A0A3M2LDA5_9NOCA|nr:bifunctional RecB family nuclease/DEAD/DEAH box helicase [Nocardia stercoris]RMI35076.1 hypothetical protein EBN03_01750 [Nocardia stercoris]